METRTLREPISDANIKLLHSEMQHIPTGVSVATYNYSLDEARHALEIAVAQHYEARDTVYVLQAWIRDLDDTQEWIITHTPDKEEAYLMLKYLEAEESKWSTVPGHEHVNYHINKSRRLTLEDIKADPTLLRG